VGYYVLGTECYTLRIVMMLRAKYEVLPELPKGLSVRCSKVVVSRVLVGSVGRWWW